MSKRDKNLLLNESSRKHNFLLDHLRSYVKARQKSFIESSRMSREAEEEPFLRLTLTP